MRKSFRALYIERTEETQERYDSCNGYVGLSEGLVAWKARYCKTEKDEGDKERQGITHTQIHISFQSGCSLLEITNGKACRNSVCMQLGEAARGVAREGTVARRDEKRGEGVVCTLS